jgi:hypothetical protein
MDMSNSEIVFLLMLGEKDDLSPLDAHRRALNEKLCKGLVPKHWRAMYDARDKLLEKKYIFKADEVRRRAISTELFRLTEKGKQEYDKLNRLYLPLISYVEYVPDFDLIDCEGCERLQKCWEELYPMLKDTFHAVLNENLQDLHQTQIRHHLTTPAHLIELIYWMRMLKLPSQFLTDNFESVFTELGLDLHKLLPDATQAKP